MKIASGEKVRNIFFDKAGVAIPGRELPDNLMVLGDLNLGGTNVERLPNGLAVKGNLILNNTKIRKLPSDIMVDGSINL